MAADFQNVTIVNIYAPSGAVRRREREIFFSNELPYLLWGIPPSLLVGGDYNSFLTNLDATGHPNYSRALQEFIRGFDLVDMWRRPRSALPIPTTPVGEPRGLIGYMRRET